MRKMYQSKTKGVVFTLAIILCLICISLCVWQFGIKQIVKESQTISPLEEGSNLQSEVYTIENGYVSRILPQTTLRDLKNNLDEENIVVYKIDNTELQDLELVGTGMKLVHNRKEYKLAVIGDLSKDGRLGIEDLIQMKLISVGIMQKPVNEYAKAGDINNDGEIGLQDLIKTNLAVINIVDLIAPVSFTPEVVTTKDTIAVLGETVDVDSGIREYWFELNNNGWVQNTDKLDNKYIFEDLEMETKYTIRMKVIDNEGNTKITKRVEVETLNEENANITIVASTEEWTNKSILVAVNFSSNVARDKKEISIDGGENWTAYTEPIIVEKNMTIKARVVNSRGEVLEEKSKTITNIDKTLPEEFEVGITTTEDSITVEATAEDGAATAEYGKSGIKEYEYTIINGIWQSVYKTADKAHTFSDLTPGVEYIIKVKVTDNAGNERVAKNGDGTEDGTKIKITPIDDIIEESGGEITIVASTEEWTNEDITVTVEYPEIEGLIGEISLDNGITWKEYSGSETIQTNTVVKARMKNNKEQVSTPKEKEITKIDKLAPQDFEMEWTATTNSIKVEVKAEDEEATKEYGKSGIRGYSFKINDEDWTDIYQSGTYTFQNLEQGQNYAVKVRAVDNAGNTTNGNQNGSVDGVTIPTTTIDDILKDLEETGKIGTIQIKPNTEAFTNQGVVIEVVYPYVDGLIREVKVGEEDWREYTEAFTINKNTVIQARLVDSSGQSGTIQSKEIINIDKLAPNDFEISGTATTRSITINVGTVENPGTTDAIATAEDACSGIKEYKYTIINGLWQWSEISTNPSHTFENLSQGKSYSVRVIAMDNAGNEKLATNSDTTTIQTNTTGSIKITADKTTGWTKEDVIVTIEYPENTEELTRMISIDGGENWQDYTNMPTQITIEENTIVKAKLMDGENQVGSIATYEVRNIDKLPPENFTINETVTNTTIEISGTTTDTISGIEEYYFSKDSGANWVQNSNKLVNSYKFEGLTPATTYSIQIKVVDKVGNERIVTKEITTDASYTLTINPNGGTYSGETTISKGEGERVTIQNPTKEGYNFTGWTLEGAGTLNGTTYTFGAGDATLTANWELLHYTVTFDAGGGTLSPSTSSITVNAGSSITLPSVTKNGFEFIGWYTGDKSYSTLEGTAGESYIPTENTTLYARYELYIYNRGDECTSVTGGWYTDSSRVIKQNNNILIKGWDLNGSMPSITSLSPLAKYGYSKVIIEYEYSGRSSSVNLINFGRLNSVNGSAGLFCDIRLNGTGTTTISSCMPTEDAPYMKLIYSGRGDDTLKIYSIKLSR